MTYSGHALTGLLLSAALLAASFAANSMAPHQHVAAQPEVIERTEAAPAGKKTTPPRRAVPQRIDPTPRIATDTYRPTLTPSPAIPSYAPAPVVPAPARQLNRCDAGGCTDIDGARHIGGAGNATLSPEGRLCNRSGTTLQCF